MVDTKKRESQGQEGKGSEPAKKNTQRWTERLASLFETRKLPYLLIIPALLFELLIHVVPMLAGVVVSFLEMNQFTLRNWAQAPFVGVQNYQVGLNFSGPIGSGLLNSFLITVAFTVLVVGFSWALGLMAALVVNTEFRARGWFRTLFFIPYALPFYIAILAWKFMLQQENGSVNALLVDNLGLLDDKPFWLIGDLAFWSMVMTSVWHHWPFGFLIMLAALQGIPEELYDAAAVDGASTFRQFLSITLPQLRSVTLVLVLALFLWTFNDFNVPFVLFGQSPPPAGNLISLHIYINSFVNWNIGLGAAMSVGLLLILLVYTVIYARITRAGEET